MKILGLGLTLTLSDIKVNAKKSYRNLWKLLENRRKNMYGLSFFACLWTSTLSRSINTQKKNEANIQPS